MDLIGTTCHESTQNSSKLNIVCTIMYIVSALGFNPIVVKLVLVQPVTMKGFHLCAIKL